MQKIYTDKNDILLKNQLDSLFSEWKKNINTKDQIVFRDDGKFYKPIEYFTEDGFFPGYAFSNPRVLFSVL